VRVGVFVAVDVLVGVLVAVRVGVTVGVWVGVRVDVGVRVGTLPRMNRISLLYVWSATHTLPASAEMPYGTSAPGAW
jgi:hypothetical protein